MSTTRRLQALLSAIAVHSYKRPRIVIVLVLLACAASVAGVQRVHISADLTELLPETFESVRNVDRLRQRFGGIGYVVALAHGASSSDLEQLARDLTPRLEALSTVRFAYYEKPETFFKRRSLYYMELEDLEEIRDRIKARADWERLRRNPFYVDLEATEKPVVDFRDMEAKYKTRGVDVGELEAASESRYLDARTGELAIFIKPTALASDLDFAKKVVADVERTIAQIPPNRYGGAQVELTGRYKKKVDLQAGLESDLRIALVLALTLVLAYLGVHFRRVSAVPLVMAPLIVGVLWTYGLAGWALGTLSILTAFVGAILLGMGIDNGVHLLGRYNEALDRGASGSDAVREAFGSTGRAATVAALTTVVGFATLIGSDFQAFREFGILASVGLFCVLSAYVLCLPALLGLGPSRLPEPPRITLSSERVQSLTRWSPWIFWLAVLGLIPLAVRSAHVSFDYDFASLDGKEFPSYRLDERVNRIRGQSQTPLVLLADSDQKAKQALDALRTRVKRRHQEHLLDAVVAEADLVPGRQPEKAAVLKELAALLEDFDTSVLSEREAQRATRLLEHARAKPFGWKDLPKPIRLTFEGTAAAREGSFTLIYPGVSLSDGQQVRRLADLLRDLPVTGGHISAAGEAMVLADVLDQVFEETPRSVLLALVAVFLCLWLMFGQLRSALLGMMPAGLSLLATVGGMAVLGMQFNYLNVVALPILLGMGVDGGAHFLVRRQEGATMSSTLRHVGVAVVGALATTAAGFAALLVAHHPGLRSVGELALLGLAFNLLATVLVLPALLCLLAQRVSKSGRRAVALAVTVGKAGLAPRGPGSLGALCALPAAWLLDDIGWPLRVLSVLTLTGLAIYAVRLYLHGDRHSDPQEIVVDEFVGCLVALIFLPFSPLWVAAGYLLFRALDVLKPWPIAIFHRWSGGMGIMGDDLAAGLIAGGILGTLHVLVT